MQKNNIKKWGTDETTFTFILARRSWLQIREIVIAYEEVSGGTSLEKAIESECRKELRMGYKAIARLAANPGYYYARVIQKAMKGVGTDEETVIRHIVNTSEVRTVLYWRTRIHGPKLVGDQPLVPKPIGLVLVLGPDQDREKFPNLRLDRTNLDRSVPRPFSPLIPAGESNLILRFVWEMSTMNSIN